VCLGTEFPVPGVGRIDALFLSPSGYLTIVETKLWLNPEARRQVVAQSIDYARAIARWTYEDLERNFRNCRFGPAGQGPSISTHVCSAEQNESFDEAAFIDGVDRCLKHGRFLLLLVGDGIRGGVSELADFLQQTPTLQYTLGLVELACYQVPATKNEYLFVPHVVARTTEVMRAIVQVDVKAPTDTAVGITVGVPPVGPDGKPPRPVRLSEREFYDLLKESTSEDLAVRLEGFLNELLSQHDALEAEFTPRKLLLKVQTEGANADRLVVLAFTPEGRLWTNKAWLDYLSAQFGADQLNAFIEGLATIDHRLRPRTKPDGSLEVPKGANAVDLRAVSEKLSELAAVVGAAVDEVAAGSTG
jgi:hypothetical protein